MPWGGRPMACGLMFFYAVTAYADDQHLLMGDFECVGNVYVLHFALCQAVHFAARLAQQMRMTAGAGRRILVMRAKTPRAVISLHLVYERGVLKRSQNPVKRDAVQVRLGKLIEYFLVRKRPAGL